jgi:hypothetical protein
MRRWTTWLVVGALAALASVAVADALRGPPEKLDTSAPTFSVALIPRNEPAASVISGVIYYSEDIRSCPLRGVRLPDLKVAPSPKLRACRFSISPNGRLASPGDVRWSSLGDVYARNEGRLIELGSTRSQRVVHFAGDAPAFKPDGSFTYVSGAKVVQCPAGEITSVCEKTVARFPGRRVLSLVWLSDTRLAAITKRSHYALEIREERLHVTVPGGRLPMRDLRVSPRGSFVSLRAASGLLVIDADGHPVALPPFIDPRALTWSPDERWSAVATTHSIFVFRTEAPEARIRRLPIVARDLTWR